MLIFFPRLNFVLQLTGIEFYRQKIEVRSPSSKGDIVILS
ncbi:hypothetical protein OSCI_3470019 [Kamptonema sp. PCC 6506]|nr:hypothetical protein OSCI_3470019 [Kamptonema sp. PCC 6506]